HGFVLPPAAAYLAWQRRADLQRLAPRPSWLGVLVVAGGVGLLLLGQLAAEFFLTRVSLIVTLAGIVLALEGWAALRVLAGPLAFLLLMIPLPAILFNQIAFPLPLFASRLGESVISAANIPVLREGNVLVLATTTLEVAEA